MPNKNYVKGRKKEYKIIREARKAGKHIIAIRSAGSKSPIDIIVIDRRSRTIRLIQAKPEAFSDKNKQKLHREVKGLGGLYNVEFVIE